MPKSNNTARLADKYELSDLEPGVDPEKAAAFLAGGTRNQAKSRHHDRAVNSKRINHQPHLTQSSWL